MTSPLTLREAQAGLFQGIFLASEGLRWTTTESAPFQYDYIRQQADLAEQAAAWLARLGGGIHSENLKGLIGSGALHSSISERLKHFEWAAGPQGLLPSLNPSGRALQLGPGLEVSFSRRPRLTASQGPAETSPEDPLPMYLLESGRLLIPSWPDEAIGVSVRTDQAPWGVQLFFNDINAFSGERSGGYDPLRESFYPDHAVVRPGTPLRADGWRDQSVSEDPKHPGQYAANRFVPTMLQDALTGVFRFRLFGLAPETLARVSGDAIVELIGGLTSNRRHLDLHAVQRRKQTFFPPVPYQSAATAPGTYKDAQAVKGELGKILHSDQSLVEMLRRHDPRTIPTLQGAGRVWQDEPGKDPYFDLGWNAAFGMTVFVVHPAAFYEWTGIRHEPQRYWPESERNLLTYPLSAFLDAYLRASHDGNQIHNFSAFPGFLNRGLKAPKHDLGGAAADMMIQSAMAVLGLDSYSPIGACATGFSGMRALTGPRSSGLAGRKGFAAGVGSLSADAGGQGSDEHQHRDGSVFTCEPEPDKK